MYDKLKIWIDRSSIDGEYWDVLGYLDTVNTSTDRHTGEMRGHGNLDGLKVSVFPTGISIVGSLTKYLHGDNLHTLDMNSTRDAISKLSTALHTDVNMGKVTALEFGTHFIMDHPVRDYLNLLGVAPHLARILTTESTVYYRSRGKIQYKNHIFYDKATEAITKGIELPPDYQDQNLLRYELRYTKNLPQQLKAKVITCSTLSDVTFYNSMLKRYADFYNGINKVKIFKTTNMGKIKTVSEAYEAFIARLILQSDNNEIESYLRELKDSNVFDARSEYTRLKKKLIAVSNKVTLTEQSELIAELDNKIKAVTEI